MFRYIKLVKGYFRDDSIKLNHVKLIKIYWYLILVYKIFSFSCIQDWIG